VKTAKSAQDRFENWLTTRKPCFICTRCGWREKREQEVYCWQCNGEYKPMGAPNGEMVYHFPTRINPFRWFVWIRLQFVYWPLDRMESRGVSFVWGEASDWGDLVDEQTALENVLKGKK